MEFLLFEHVSGYALFELKRQEDIVADKTSHSYADTSRLMQLVKLVSFFKFDDMECASEHLNMISQNKVHEELKSFLKLNNVEVVHCDRSLSQPLAELGFKTKQSHVLQRAIRLNQNKLLDITEISQKRLALSVSHGFSRRKIEYDVKKEDNLVIQASLLMDQLEKDIGLYSKRLSNIYDFSLPELKHVFTSVEEFVLAAKILGDFRTGLEAKLDEVETQFGREKRDILAMKIAMSIGSKIDDFDARNMCDIANIIEEKIRMQKDLLGYVQEKLDIIAPNLAALVGSTMAAKLIAQAGGLLNLAKCPSSTVQVLGAEPALFRALKARTATPKHGIIFGASAMQKTEDRNKGKVARFLASKVSLVSRIDCFSEEKTSEYGKALRKLVEKKIKSFTKEGNVEKTDDVLRKIALKLERLKQ